MNIKDYLPLYIGCDMKTKDVFGRSAIRTLTAIVGSKAIYDCVETEDVDMAHSWDMNYTSDPDRPLLRPLSDMTEEEDAAADDLYYSIADKNSQDFEKVIKAYAAVTNYLLSLRFDLFGLIDAGLAIDKTKEVVK